MNVRTFNKAVLIAVWSIIFASCANVKEYQKSRINDSEMILGNRKVEKNELNFQSYRERERERERALRELMEEKLAVAANVIKRNISKLIL
jgi:hypothetical protein